MAEVPDEFDRNLFGEIVSRPDKRKSRRAGTCEHAAPRAAVTIANNSKKAKTVVRSWMIRLAASATAILVAVGTGLQYVPAPIREGTGKFMAEKTFESLNGALLHLIGRSSENKSASHEPSTPSIPPTTVRDGVVTTGAPTDPTPLPKARVAVETGSITGTNIQKSKAKIAPPYSARSPSAETKGPIAVTIEFFDQLLMLGQSKGPIPREGESRK